MFQVNNYKIVVPYAPESINKVIGYGKSEGDIVVLKHKWQRLASIILEQAIVESKLPSKFKGRIGVFFILYFKTDRGRDGDNYSAMCKGIIDAMVRKNMIPDDNYNYVDDDGRRLRIDPERPRAEVYIKEKIKGSDLITIKPYGEIKGSSSDFIMQEV